MKRLLSLVLCALLLVSLVVPVYAETDPTEATDATETTAAATDGATEASADAADDAVTELFNRLMSATTYEELDEMMENMTDEEYELLGQFSDEQNAALTAHKNELSEYEQTTLADVTVEAGRSVNYPYNNARNYKFRVLLNEKVVDTVTASGNGNTVNVMADESATAGTYTVQYRNKYNGSGSWRDAFTVEVTAISGTVKVYVYVATMDPDTGDSWVDNEEFTDLIGLYVPDGNNYFPVGEIELDRSFLSGKTTANYKALITDDSDWDALIVALSNLNTSTLIDDNYKGSYEFSKNNQNKVAQYLSQAAKDVGYGSGSQRSALFKWETTNHSFGFADQNVGYHLDLRFNMNRITFKTGNNGLTSAETSTAYDGIQVDYRAYITGSIIQEPKQVIVPAGYKFVGYYSDADFTIPWDGIGTPLNEDQTVYIKITQLDNVVLYYKNVSGEAAGSLSSYSEGLNPVTGQAVGSTATAKDGYSFVGWYSDKDCTTPLSTNAKYVPTKEESARWVDGTTYYAKFEEKKATINYVVVGPDGYGTVDLNDEDTTGPAAQTSETVNIATGTAVGATAAPSSNAYKFVGWYDNNECTGDPISTAASYVPSKPSDGNWPETSTYYAKFESNVGSLTINKKVEGVDTDKIPAGLEFTFTVYDAQNTKIDSVTLNSKNNWTATVPNLAVGTYTVVETKVDIANYKLISVTANKVDVTNGTEETTSAASVSISGGETATVDFVNTYALDIANLTIIKNGGSGELFEFSVVCKERDVNMTVCIPGDSSITLKDLPLGTYTVTEDTGWSYRYSCSLASDSVTIKANGSNSLTFTNTLTNDKWLGGESFARNIFTGSTGTTG